MLFVQVFKSLKIPEAMKIEPSNIACRDLLCLAAIRYQRLEEVASSLVRLTKQGDHVPLLAAHVAQWAEINYNSTQLVSLFLMQLPGWRLSALL